MLNDICLFTHGQIISVFELSRMTWIHHSATGDVISHYNRTKPNAHFNLCHFDYSQSELKYAKLVSTN